MHMWQSQNPAFSLQIWKTPILSSVEIAGFQCFRQLACSVLCFAILEVSNIPADHATVGRRAADLSMRHEIVRKTWKTVICELEIRLVDGVLGPRKVTHALGEPQRVAQWVWEHLKPMERPCGRGAVWRYGNRPRLSFLSEVVRLGRIFYCFNVAPNGSKLDKLGTSWDIKIQDDPRMILINYI